MITARVPATSANIGSGFDCLGIAVGLYNSVTLVPNAPFKIELGGEGADLLPRDRSNLVFRTIQRFFSTIERPMPSFALRMHNTIPMTGGLGSSSAALLGALLVANRLAGDPWPREEILRTAFELEGHPDNVAPALLGGVVLAVVDERRLITVPLPFPDDLQAVVFVPRFSTSTREARRLLPHRIGHPDAVFNVSRAALLVAALSTNRLDLLRVATEDRLHQPYRQVLFPSMNRLFDGALKGGAYAAWLSGSGSALMALASHAGASAVARGFESAARDHGVAGRAVVVDLAREGASVEETRDGPQIGGNDN